MAKPTSHYLFIDGGCLRSTLEWKVLKYVRVEECRIDLEEVASQFSKVFLYDAVPTREPNEAESDYLVRIKPQQDMLDAAARINRVHVYEGTAHRRNKRLEQKKVDVMIAVDMLTHTFRRNMDYATLLTGDGDFHPLVDEGMFVNVWFPVGRTSKDLLRAADGRRPLLIDELFAFLEPSVRRNMQVPEVAGMASVNFRIQPMIAIHTFFIDERKYDFGFDGQRYVFSWEQHGTTHIVRDADSKLLAQYIDDRHGIEIPPFTPNPSWKPMNPPRSG